MLRHISRKIIISEISRNKKKKNFEINYKKKEKQKNEYGDIYLEIELLQKNIKMSMET